MVVCWTHESIYGSSEICNCKQVHELHVLTNLGLCTFCPIYNNTLQNHCAGHFLELTCRKSQPLNHMDMHNIQCHVHALETAYIYYIMSFTIASNNRTIYIHVDPSKSCNSCFQNLTDVTVTCTAVNFSEDKVHTRHKLLKLYKLIYTVAQ